MVLPLPHDRLEWVAGWGSAVGAPGFVYRPSTVDGVREVLAMAADAGRPVVLRGAGCSYGDAALLAEAVVLQLTRLDRVLAWDPQSGVVDVEPGVTVSRLWRSLLGDGWWPPVVTGTADPTIGGALAMNVHGKNNWARGTLGEHCSELDLLLATGEVRTVRRSEEPALLAAVLGSAGQLGVITRARLQLKRVHSGLLHVRAVSAPDLTSILAAADAAKDDWEYVVGWIDGFAGGRRLGRGLLHLARHLTPEEDPAPAQTLRPENHEPPEAILGVLPRAVVWRLMRPWTNRPGMRAINLAKYRLGSTLQEGAEYRQPLGPFSFLLDWVPSWRRIYEPGGLIQHQSFVPAAAAEEVFRRQLEACRRAGRPPFLAVLKRHRPDEALLGHGVDGFSLALDLPVPPGARDDVWRLVAALAEPVAAAGGRFYPAKDAALPRELYRAAVGEERLAAFARRKAELDPGHRLDSALARRLLA